MDPDQIAAPERQSDRGLIRVRDFLNYISFYEGIVVKKIVRNPIYGTYSTF